MKIKSLSALVLALNTFAAFGLPNHSAAGFIQLKDGKGIIEFNNEPEFVRTYVGLYASLIQTAKKLLFGDGILYFIVTSSCVDVEKFLKNPENSSLIQRDETRLYDTLEDALKSDEFKRSLSRKGESPYIMSIDIKSSDMTAVHDKSGARIADTVGYGSYRPVNGIPCLD